MLAVGKIMQILNKPHDGRLVLAVLIAVLFTFSFAFWIWPTPYREWTSRGGKHHNGPWVYHRVNRLTGAREYAFNGLLGTMNWQPESGRVK